jgi:lipid A 3-O-deacylase PagL
MPSGYASKRSVILSLAPLLWALSAFPQAEVASTVAGANQVNGEALRARRQNQILGAPTLPIFEYSADDAAPPEQRAGERPMSDLDGQQAPAILENKPRGEASIEPLVETTPVSKPADFNREIYYRNKLEFSLDAGWLPINIPFPLDVFVGDNYNTYPLKYTLVPIFASLRWHTCGIGGPWILRGNFDLTFTGSVTAIPRGPESRYFSYIMGIRRNFVPHNRRIAPYFDVRLGVGNIDAKGPQGVEYAQGQDITFTVNMGSGLRYNFSPRYAISAGLNFMHISNLDLSESNGKPNWGVRNYGINVYGPMVGIDMQLGRHQRESAH